MFRISKVNEAEIELLKERLKKIEEIKGANKDYFEDLNEQVRKMNEFVEKANKLLERYREDKKYPQKFFTLRGLF